MKVKIEYAKVAVRDNETDVMGIRFDPREEGEGKKQRAAAPTIPAD
jgi:hypothetical protein